MFKKLNEMIADPVVLPTAVTGAVLLVAGWLLIRRVLGSDVRRSD